MAKMSNFLIFAFLFCIGSCIGWCIEVIFRRFVSRSNPEKKWINPGFLVGPYLPLYGFGLWGMFCVSFLSSLTLTGSNAVDTTIILVVMAVVMTVIEYIAGLIFIKGMKVKLWDYSEERFNIQGIICPKFTLAWGLLGCLYYFTVNPYVVGWVIWLSKHLSYSFFVGMFFGVFLIDVCYSMQFSNSIRRFAKEKEIVVKYEELKEFIRQRREELEEKKRFVLAFKTEEPLSRQLEKFVSRSIDRRAQQIKKVEERLKDVKEEHISDLKGEEESCSGKGSSHMQGKVDR